MNMKMDLCISRITSNDQTVRLISWLVDHKAFVEAGQVVLLVETSKVTVEIASEYTGYIYQHYAENEVLNIGDVAASIYSTHPAIEEPEKTPPSNIDNSKSNTLFSNSAKRYIEENKLNPNDFLDMGLVTEEKIVARLAESKTAQDKSIELDKTLFPTSDISPVSYEKLAEISVLNRTNEDSIPSSLTIQFASDDIRKKIAAIPWLNGRISTYLLHVLAKMLADYPKFTAYYKNKHIYFYNKINLGVAIDLDKGLKVGVIKDANTLSLFDLHMAIIDCIACYFENNFSPALFSHSTITTTDLSNEGILHFQPVLNADQSVIIGIGGDSTLPGSPMSITIVFDHRVLSGQEVATFLRCFKEKILGSVDHVMKDAEILAT